MQQQLQQYQRLLGGIYQGVDNIYQRVSAIPELTSLKPTNVVYGTAPNIRALVNKGYIPPAKRVGEGQSIDSFLEEILTTLKADIGVLESPDIGKKTIFRGESKATKDASRILKKYELEKLKKFYEGVQQVLGQDIEGSVRYWVELQEKTGEETRIGTELTDEDKEKLQPMLQILGLHNI